FNMDVLRQSYAYLVNRHAILRTSFHHAYSKQTIQAVHQYMAPDFRHQQLEAVAVQAYKTADCEEGFDLHRGPCMRLMVLELNADEYEFIWTHHHILMDGWCGSVVLQEFFAIYRSLLQNSIPVLPPVAPYVNYIRWLAEQDQENSHSYWTSYLDGYEQVATLPFREAGSEAYLTGESMLTFSAAEAAQITRYCRHTGITENTFIQGAWSYLLSRYNNTEDVVFGAVVSGRPAGLEGVENMIGLFINTIPVRARYNGQMTVKALLQQLHQDAVKSLPHHYVKLSDIQSRSIPGNRLFDHILIHENFPVWEIAEGKETGGKGLEELELLSSDAAAGTNYPFNVVVITRDQQLKIKFNYNKNLYTDAAVKCISEQLKGIISLFSGPEDKTLEEIAGLTSAEEEQVLKTFNDTAVDYAATKTIITAFKERVQAYPEVTALVFENRALTYRELDERSNCLASYLLSKGVVKEQPVAICMNRSIELIVGILGILKSGGAYVPIDPSYPAERIQYIAKDSGTGIILTREELLPSFAGITDKQVVLIDRDWSSIAAFPAQEVIADVSADSLAYIIYTSGSTGKPKGVMIEHTSMINLIEWHIKRYDVTPLSRSTTMAGVGFDACSLEMWSALLSASSLYIIDNELRLRPELLLQFYHQHGITHAFVPPALIPDMVAAPQPEGLLLKYVLIGGDRLPYVDVSKLSFTLVNQYGPTESTVMVTDYPISKHNRKAPPIGKPIANTQLYILGDRRQLLPVGAVGEICIGGVQLARGYLNNPLLTAEKFIPNPYHPDERIYRTGDIGRWLPDGNIECLGRLDDQLKVRGYRIEAGEIEHALTQLDGIDAAIALIHNGYANRKILVVFFTGSNNNTATEIRQQLQTLLPEYMIPARLIKLDRFPLTPNGKIDKKALVLLPVEDGHSSTTYVPPRSKAEADLTAIIAGILETPLTAVGIRENFFDMGANSLDLVRMTGEISRQFDKEIKVTQLFTYPNIQELSDYLFNSQEPELLPTYENIEQDLDDILTVFE
ncbi:MULTISPECIES: non-ribosomal peptide synthetase, partial [unclassified Chitinophaga]|uniref:non-ribosomal peptide synthetase n=1 Tax=unclassified Chitinophaga TaxID=2619133 RepID=UPI00301057B3